jgi:ribosomal protein S18 acetylase RimI-like enzyme
MFAARLASESDLEPILAMMEDFNAHEAIPFDRERFAPRVRTLLASAGLGGVLILTAADVIAGYAVVTFGYDCEYGGRDAFLTDLYVVGSRRGEGIGEAGLAAAEEFARANGVHALHLGVRSENAPARALYEKSGYRAQDRVIMTKPLD